MQFEVYVLYSISIFSGISLFYLFYYLLVVFLRLHIFDFIFKMSEIIKTTGSVLDEIKAEVTGLSASNLAFIVA